MNVVATVLMLLWLKCDISHSFQGKLIFLNNTDRVTLFDTSQMQSTFVNTLNNTYKTGAVICNSKDYVTSTYSTILRFNIETNETENIDPGSGYYHQFACSYGGNTYFGEAYTVVTDGDTYVHQLEFGADCELIGTFDPNIAKWLGMDSLFSFDHDPKDNGNDSIDYRLYASFINYDNNTYNNNIVGGYLFIMEVPNGNIDGPYFYPKGYYPYFIVPPHNNYNYQDLYGMVMNEDQTKFWWVKIRFDDENNIIFDEFELGFDYLFNPSVAILWAGNNTGFVSQGNYLIQFDSRNGSIIQQYQFDNNTAINDLALLS